MNNTAITTASDMPAFC